MEVPIRTVALSIQEPWNWILTPERFYFCDIPDCHAAYLGDDDSVFSKSMERTRVGAKERNWDSMLCHCFCVSRSDFDRYPSFRDFVMERTKVGQLF